ncbi:uncharacterized protein [Typha angustifolia]|uniref:uncharacterized protein n=1 Tax=Typha angustifolia TaxID=59011 RepID=UPI003C2DE8D4
MMGEVTPVERSKDGGEGRRPPLTVTFPDALRREKFDVPPIKLEVEESADDMSPRNMWQVYALGGFMVLRWIWARWKERKDKGSSPEDSSA